MTANRNGALISEELTARVYWALGRCTAEDPSEAIEIGRDLLHAIQQELTETFNAGVTTGKTARDSTNSVASGQGGGEFGHLRGGST